MNKYKLQSLATQKNCKVNFFILDANTLCQSRVNMQRNHSHRTGGQRLQGQRQPRSSGQNAQNTVQPQRFIGRCYQQNCYDRLEFLVQIVTCKQPQQCGRAQVLNLIGTKC